METGRDKASLVVETIGELVREIAIVPDQLSVVGTRQGPSVVIQITANAADCRRIVGKAGQCLSALKSVAHLLAEGDGRRDLQVNFTRVTSTSEHEAPFLRYVERTREWSVNECNRHLDLFAKILGAMFPGSDPTWNVTQRGDSAWWVTFLVGDGENRSRIEQCRKAVHALLVTISYRNGITIYADVTTAGGRAHEPIDAARRTA